MSARLKSEVVAVLRRIEAGDAPADVRVSGLILFGYADYRDGEVTVTRKGRQALAAARRLAGEGCDGT